MENQNNTTDKLVDKAFSRLIMTSVLGILVCIVCLCSATWAWFSTGISGGNNVVESGNFDLDIAITDSSDVQLGSTEIPGGEKFVFENAGLHTVTLTKSDDTTVKKGYCVIKCGGVSYYTSSLNADMNQFVFTLDVKEPGVAVFFSSSWGISSAQDLINPSETLVLGEASNQE